MTAPSTAGAATLTPPALDAEGWNAADWAAELDMSIIESGVAADQMIRMTDDGCNSTCGTACTSC
jgi:FxLD family lantipeptide